MDNNEHLIQIQLLGEMILYSFIYNIVFTVIT